MTWSSDLIKFYHQTAIYTFLIWIHRKKEHAHQVQLFIHILFRLIVIAKQWNLICDSNTGTDSALFVLNQLFSMKYYHITNHSLKYYNRH